MIKMIGLLNVQDIVRLVVLALGSYLIYASYKKNVKDNKKVKVIVRLLAVVALATILKAFYKGNFSICGLDFFSNAAIVVILHILVLAATSQLGVECVNKEVKSSSHSSQDCTSWSSDPSSSSFTSDSHYSSSSSSLSSCKKCSKKPSKKCHKKDKSSSSSTFCSSSW